MKKGAPASVANFGARVTMLTDRFVSVAEAAREMRIKEQTLRNARNGKGEPRAPLLIALSQGLNVSIEYLLGLSDDPTPPTVLGGRVAPVIIPVSHALASAGAGAENGDVQSGDAFPFPPGFIEKLGGNPASVESLRARGDSMEPTIENYALLIIDTSETARALPTFKQKLKKTRPEPIPPDPIYVFVQDGHVRLKRLRLLDERGMTAIISDNIALHPPEFARLSELKIIGRVIWWDNRL